MACANEMTLEQLLADPLVRLVMSSDDVGEADIRRLIRTAAARRTAMRADNERLPVAA